MVSDCAKMQAAHGFPSSIHLELEDKFLAPTLMHIACMYVHARAIQLLNLAETWEVHNLEPWKRPLGHLCLLPKQAPSPWNFQGEGHLSAPDLGLASSNFPCDSRMAARLPTDWSVWGCCGPSCDSRPASAERCRSAAWL